MEIKLCVYVLYIGKQFSKKYCAESQYKKANYFHCNCFVPLVTMKRMSKDILGTTTPLNLIFCISYNGL